MSYDFNIYVADLERYNAGYLVGEWFDLDAYSDVDDLKADIQKMLDRHNNEEWAIHDYDCSFNTHGMGEYVSLESLWTLKDMLDADEDKTDWLMDWLGFEEVIGYGVSGLDSWCIIRFDTNSPGTPEFKLGYHMVEVEGFLEVPKEVKPFFNYAEYGEWWESTSTGFLWKGGFLYRTD